jgi:hypothetical protein
VTAVRRRAWWILAVFAVTLVLFGATDLASGVTADPAIAQALAGRTPAQVQAEDPIGYRLYDFASRSGGQLLIVLGIVLAAIIAIPYRGGQRWAWRLLWILPIWAATVPLLYLAFGTAPNQPPAPPMISGPIIAALAAAALLVDRERFRFGAPGAS